MKIPEGITLDPNPPSAEEYCSLRDACGLRPRTLDAARIALPNSLYSICLRDSGKLVGMGRVVGDLGCHVMVTDIAVAPEAQGKGLGHFIMSKINQYIHNNVPDCCFVCLFTHQDDFFKKHSYVHTTQHRGMRLDRSQLLPQSEKYRCE